MAKFPLYQWKKSTGGGTSTPIDTTNFAKKNEVNTFTQANNFNAGFTVPDSAVGNVNKEVDNANDNQIINYKGFYWKRLHSQGDLTMNGGQTQAYNITTNDLIAQRHIRVMVRITPPNYDYTLVFDIICNSLGYKNFGEVKAIHWQDNTGSNLDPTKFVYVTVAQHQNNTLRLNIKNATGAQIRMGSIHTYIQTIKPKFQR